MNLMTSAQTISGSDISVASTFGRSVFFWIKLLCLLSLLSYGVQAEILDAPDEGELDDQARANPAIRMLLSVVDDLHADGIDVLLNLNERTLARGRPDRPRLGILADLYVAAYPTTPELLAAEQDYLAGEISALFLLNDSQQTLDRDSSTSEQDFLTAWLQAADDQRLSVTHSATDREAAQRVAMAAEKAGWRVLAASPVQSSTGEQVSEVQTDTLMGRFFATTKYRLTLDSSNARRYEGTLPDLAWAGERVRRNSASIFRDSSLRDDASIARTEPAVFLKETLGDEYSESTIQEIVVPGGVALGETASFNAVSPERVSFLGGELRIEDSAGELLRLPQLSVNENKALFDFAQRSLQLASDAIVDIDADSRVRISAALRDTDAGYALMHADTLPFNYVDYLPVSKSVMIDTDVAWFRVVSNPAELDFVTEFEVRFLSADNMRLAQTRAAIVYEYDGSVGATELVRTWGRDARRLRENFDFAGLGNEVQVVARYAGWIGLWRHLLEEDVPFIEGRYEFMKVDKAGAETPSRYRP